MPQHNAVANKNEDQPIADPCLIPSDKQRWDRYNLHRWQAYSTVTDFAKFLG